MTPTEREEAVAGAIQWTRWQGGSDLDQARAAITALDIDKIEREAYLRGWNEASKEASEEIRDIERQARWEAQDAYHQGQSDGRDW